MMNRDKSRAQDGRLNTVKNGQKYKRTGNVLVFFLNKEIQLQTDCWTMLTIYHGTKLYPLPPRPSCISALISLVM